LNQHCRRLISVVGKFGIKINVGKTEYVIIGRTSRGYLYLIIPFIKRKFIKIEHHIFKRMLHFKYLGFIITQYNIKNEVDNKIQMVNICYYGLGNIFSSKVLSKK